MTEPSFNPSEVASYDGDDLEVLMHMPRYHNWIMQFFRAYISGHVVEYGSGTGTISQHIAPLATRLDLVEPSINLHEKLRARVNHDNLSISADTLERHVVSRQDQSIDTAILINVLEHIQDDAGALRELHRVLTPKTGHLLIFVPALNWLMSDLDRIHGHHRRYHLGHLKREVESVGFEIIKAQYGDFIGIMPWLILNKMLGSTKFNPRMIRFYDKFIHKITTVIEKVVTPPLGKNIIIVARRR